MYDGAIFRSMQALVKTPGAANATAQATHTVSRRLSEAEQALHLLDAVVEADISKNLLARTPFSQIDAIRNAIWKTGQSLADLGKPLMDAQDVRTPAARTAILCDDISSLRESIHAVYPTPLGHYGKAVAAALLGALAVGAAVLEVRTRSESSTVNIASVSCAAMAGTASVTAMIGILKDRRSLFEVSRAVAALDEIASLLLPHADVTQRSGEAAGNGETAPLLAQPGMVAGRPAGATPSQIDPLSPV